MKIIKIARLKDYNIRISFRIKNKVFKYKYGEFPYIEYFNQINLKNYNVKYFAKMDNILNNIQHHRYINHNMYGISFTKFKN
jgi:hypothetical protein